MATSFITCSLAPPPPPPRPRTSPPPPLPLPSQSWRSRCVSTAACVIIGSALAFADGPEAHAQPPIAAPAPAPPVLKWSQKRACPPWHANTLENFVPENLPRPSAARGRSVSVSFYTTRSLSQCFSL